MIKPLPVWLLIATLLPLPLSLQAAPQIGDLNIISANPEITEIKLYDFDTLPSLARIVTFSRNADQVQKNPEKHPLVAIELLISKKYKQPPDVTYLNLNDLTHNAPYSVATNAQRIEAVLEKRIGNEKPPKLRMLVRIAGIHPRGTSDPYLLECIAPIKKYKWGKVNCQPGK